MQTAPTTFPEAKTAEQEQDLLRRLRAGEDAAFEELVRTYGPRMLSIIRRYLPLDQDSHDVLQEAFLSAYKAIGKFEGHSGLATWLHRIAVNAALMRLRSRKRHPERQIEDFLPRYVDDGHRQNPSRGWTSMPEPAVITEENRSLVRKSIDMLPESFRTVLLMRDIEEMSTEETAEQLNLSVANVKTRLHRARQALRELLDRHFGASTS
jgi:RNA polymerase sigma-70 factor (ECF subfamily)